VGGEGRKEREKEGGGEKREGGGEERNAAAGAMPAKMKRYLGRARSIIRKIIIGFITM
jgi:hypothetical protein